jgi:hypothetical protein
MIATSRSEGPTTEGFETADLTAARALLDELSDPEQT